MIFIHSLHSEWLKTKRSSAFWLSIFGGFFIPTIYLIGYLHDKTCINDVVKVGPIWTYHFMRCWQNMSFLLLPMGVILACSLITQLEFKNNTWKQLHTTPQSFSVIFFAKLLVILFMTIQFFIFFNIGVILSGVIPCLIFDHNFSNESIPALYFLKANAKFFISCLPIIAFQYLVSLKFKNFMVAIGAGLMGLIGTLIAFSWKHIYLSPFSYSSYCFGRKIGIDISSYLLAGIYFLLLIAVAYFTYISKKEKG